MSVRVDGNASFAELLRRYRVLADLTQQDLAERAQMSVRGISDLERAINLRPRRDTVRLLADALELEAEERSQFEAAAREAALLSARPPGAARGPFSLPPFIGRTDELAALERYLRGTGHRVLMVAGEPGIGKSRFLQEASHRAGELRLEVIQGGCQRRSAGEPYAPLPQALASWVDRQPKARLRPLLKAGPWLIRFLPELAGLASAPDEVPATSPQQERRLMFRDVARLLSDAAGTEGMLLMLDDLQWAGPDLFDALSAILASAPNIRLIGAYRDTDIAAHHPLSAWLADVARERRLLHLSFEPLTNEEATSLLEALLPVGSDERRLLEDRIVPRASGVPFFLVSYAEGVRAGAVAAEADVPWDLAQNIRQRLASLPEEGQRVLMASAVIGRAVSLPLLAAVLKTPEDELLIALDLGRRSGLLLEDDTGSYRFRHDVVRDVVEGDLGAGRRMMLHQRIGEALERREGEPPLELLAYHWSRSGTREKAAEYLKLAGDRARGQYACLAAADYYRAAAERLDTLGQPEEGARVRSELGFVLTLVGHYDEALEALEAAIRAYGEAGDENGLAYAASILGWTHFFRGTAGEGVERLQPLLAALQRGPPSAGLASLWNSVADLFWGVGSYSEQLVAAERAIEVARSAGDEEQLARGRSERRVALQYLGRDVDVSEGEPDSDASRAGALDLMVGRFDLRRHRAGLERVVEGAREKGLVLQISFSQTLLGYVVFVLGDWALARRYWEDALELVRSLGTTVMASGPRMDLGWLSLHEGRWEEASRWLHEALDMATGDLFATRVIQGRLAFLNVLQGRPEAAIERLTPLLDRPGFEEPQVTSLLPQLAWAHLELGEEGRAENIVSDAVRRASASRDRLDLVHALHIRGKLLVRQERWDEAERVLEQTVSMARDIPYPYMEASALHDLGAMHARQGEREAARTHLEAALAIFGRLGAGKDVERSRHILAQLDG